MVSLLKINNKKDNEQATDDECYGFDECELPFDTIVSKSKPQPSVSKQLVPFQPQSPRIELIKNANNVEPFMQSRAKTHNLIYYELTTFKELGTCNFNFIQKLLDSKSTDGISRDGWKTLCWLNTKSHPSNLSFKTFKIDGELVKLFGGKGDVLRETEFTNYNSKVTRFPKNSKLIKYNSTKVSSLSELKNLVVVNRDSSIESILSRKRRFRLTQPQSNMVVKLKPGPLQSKLKKFPPHPYMEPPEIFEMPDIMLEVFPAVDKPLDNDIKCYLKYIQPSESITREWAEFSVSTLVEKFKKAGDKKSFEFCIPYVNDQKHVLVRRRKRLQDSGKDERAFKEKYDEPVDYEFMKQDMVDDSMKECANILGDMFESVSLGLSENLYIQNDSDLNYNAEDGYFENKIIEENETFIASKKKGRKSGKTNTKLMNELRKLNATIVNADEMDLESMKKCENLFCSLGCVCESLRGQLTQTHCGLTKCMLKKECSCKRNFLPTSNAQSEFISEDDVIKIREQTTRSLAPVEKDFTSTVVIKNNETLLINESQFNRKRRSTRCQKRYNDDLFYDELNPDKQAVEPLPAPPEPKPPSPVKESELEKNRKVFVYEDTYKKIKDLSIVVPRFEFLDNIVPWCIYHNSYKCNCKNNMNLRSKRSLDKKGVEENAVVSEKTAEKTPPSKRKSLMKNDFPEKKFKKDESPQKPKEVPEVVKDVKDKDVKETKTVLAQKSQRYMSRKEPPQSQGFVSVVISDSDMEISDKEDEEDQLASSHHKRYVVFNTKKNDHCMRTFGVQRNPYYIGPVTSLVERPVEEPTPKSKPPDDDECMIVEKKDEVITIPDDDDEDSNESNGNGVELVPDPPAPESVPETQPAIEQPPSIEKTLYTDGKTSITKMNSLVTKKVIEIQKSQSMKVDNIVNPGVGKILISTYANLLSWLIDGKIHIWKIETEAEDGYFVVTTYKAMPVIDNVIGIMNIKADRNRESLPVIFQLLLSEALSTKLNRLSVVLFGNSHYWTIRGFSYFEKNLTSVNAVKVLPETHPILSKKIEKLHNIIIDQEIRIRNDIQKSNPNIALPAFQPVTANQPIPPPAPFSSPQQTPTTLKQISPSQIIPPPQMTTTVLSQKSVDITQSLIRPVKPSLIETTRHAKLPKMEIPQLFAAQDQQSRNTAHVATTHVPTTPVHTTHVPTTHAPTTPVHTTHVSNTPIHTTHLPTTPVPNTPVPISTPNSDASKPTPTPPPGYMEKETDHFAQSQTYKNTTQTNIMHRQVTTEELSKIHLPVFKDYDHRWYVIDFKDDFTYMYIPETDEFLSHHRLQKSAAQSNYKNKVVQLSMRKRSYFNCFVTPPSLSYLYMGPFSGNTKPPIVLLLSLVHGKVVPRQESINPYGSVTTSFIISVGENGIDCPGVPVSSPINKDRTVRDEVRLVAPPTPMQPKVFKNLFDTSSKTTNIGHITIQKLSVQAGGVASISIPQAVVDPPTVPDPVTQNFFPPPQSQPHHQQQNSNSFLRKCLSAAPKPITAPSVKTTVNQLSNISGLKISQVKSLREEEAIASAGLTPKPIFNTYSKKQFNATTPTKSNVSSSSDDNTEYGYYIADHDTAPKVFAKKTEEAITLKTPAVEESASRIVRVKMESAVIRFLNEFIFKNFKLSPTNWRFLKINKKDAKDLLSPIKSSRAANST